MFPNCTNERRRYLCERCGGMGRQEAGCYNMATRKYDSAAGVCELCNGEGYLGEIPFTYELKTSYFAGDCTFVDNFCKFSNYLEAIEYIENNKPPIEYEWELIDDTGHSVAYTQYAGKQICELIKGEWTKRSID